jgi:NADPH:quinone reductase-like Zn-dependent oxidoreductase
MRAVQGKELGGDIDTTISVEDGVTVPRLDDLPPRQRSHVMIVQTRAVALAPGDVRVLSGKTRELQGPPSFPYIPGGDCSGIVVELPKGVEGTLPFQVGDRVCARFDDIPRGALGEYALVSTKVADKIPDSVSFEEAAALVGASPALVLADYIQEGERVLVIGASGGMGSIFCQMLKHRGAAYVVGVSSSPDFLLDPPIACNEAIDYRTTDVFELSKFQENKFDVIVDLAGKGFSMLEENVAKNEPLIVKTAAQGGRFITTIPPVGPIYEMHNWLTVINHFLFATLWCAIKSRTWHRSTVPKYTFALCLDAVRAPVTKAMELAASGKLKAVMEGPFPFTSEGVRSALRLQESRHAKGKGTWSGARLSS